MARCKKLVIKTIAAILVLALQFQSVASRAGTKPLPLNQLRIQLADVDKLEPSRHVDLAREQLRLCVLKWGITQLETTACRIDLGEAQLAEMFFADAEATLRIAVTALDQTAGGREKPILLARGQSLLGAVLVQQGKYEEAQALLEQALAQQPVKSIERFRTLARLSQLYEAKQLKNELTQTAGATAAAQLPNMSVTDHALLAATDARLACVVQSGAVCADKWEKVLALMETAYAKNDSLLTLALGPLAEAYNMLRDPQRAEAIGEQILQIERSRLRPNSRRLGSALNDLGGLYGYTNRSALAEQVQKEAVALAENDPTAKQPLAMRLANLGDTLLGQRKYQEAEPVLRRSVELTVSVFGTDNPNSTYPRQGLAELLGSSGRVTEAIALNSENIRILTSALGRDHRHTLYAMHYQSSYLLRNNQPIEAKEILATALMSARTTFGPTAQDTLNIQTTYVQALLDSGETTAALREARAVLSEIRAAALDATTRIQTKAGAADRFAIAINAAVRLRNVLLKIAAKNSDAVQDALLAQQFVERYLDGSAAWQTGARLAAEDPALRRLADEQQIAIASVGKLRAQLGTAYRERNDGDIARLSADLDRDREAASKITASIDARYPAFANLAGGHDLLLDELTSPSSRLLKPGEAALFLIQEPKGHYALLVKRGYSKLVAAPIGTKKMSALVAELRAGIAIAGAVTGSDLPAFDLKASAALYKSIIAPFEADLRGVGTLYSSVDGPLASLPLSVLVTKMPTKSNNIFAAYRQARWFGDKYDIVTLPAINALRALKLVAPPSKADRPLLAIADPALAGNKLSAATNSFASLRSAQTAGNYPVRTASAVCALRPLPDTRREAEAMAKAMGASANSMIFGNGASEATLATLSQSGELRRYRALLFATHGLAAGATPSEEPAIILTPGGGCDEHVAATTKDTDDGLLTASEITMLSLDADVVVLSGCNTASGDANGASRPLSGLARAFLYAGARQIIVSHWSVDSAATAELMTFMARKRADGASYASALRSAMRSLRNDRNGPTYRSHPAFWAAFSTVGESR